MGMSEGAPARGSWRRFNQAVQSWYILGGLPDATFWYNEGISFKVRVAVRDATT